jgi:hypothetical protein
MAQKSLRSRVSNPDYFIESVSLESPQKNVKSREDVSERGLLIWYSTFWVFFGIGNGTWHELLSLEKSYRGDKFGKQVPIPEAVRLSTSSLWSSETLWEGCTWREFARTEITTWCTSSSCWFTSEIKQETFWNKRNPSHNSDYFDTLCFQS